MSFATIVPTVTVSVPVPVPYPAPPTCPTSAATPAASDWKTALAIEGGDAMVVLVCVFGVLCHYHLRNRRPAIKPIAIPTADADPMQLLNAARGPLPTVIAAPTSTTPDTQPTHTHTIEQGQSRASWTRGVTASMAKARAVWRYMTTGRMPIG